MSPNSHRLRAVIAIAAVTILGVAGATAVASGPDRTPLSSETAEATTSAKAERGSFSRVSPASAVRGSGKSVKKQLRKLTKAHNKLVRSHNRLVTSHNKLAGAFYNCERTVAVTQYAGYDYNGSIGATTALDFTDPGDSVDEQLVVWVC